MAPGKSLRQHAFTPRTRICASEQRLLVAFDLRRRCNEAGACSGLWFWLRDRSDSNWLSCEPSLAQRLREDSRHTRQNSNGTRPPQRGAKQEKRPRGPQRLPVARPFIEKDVERSRHEQAREHRLGGGAGV